MASLKWADVKPNFESGLDRGVLYVDGSPGVSWPGLVRVAESATGGQPQSIHIDGIKLGQGSSYEEFTGTIDAYYSPFEFDVCDGTVLLNEAVRVSRQRRYAFGLSYRTQTANGYKVHLVYNAMALPTVRSYTTLSDNPESGILSWDLTTTPVPISDLARTSHISVDRDQVNLDHLATLEGVLYGTNESAPRMPFPDEVVSIFTGVVPFTAIDNGDGTYTAEGLAGYVTRLSHGEFNLFSASISKSRNGRFQIERATKKEG